MPQISSQSRFIVTLTDAAAQHPQPTLERLHTLLTDQGTVLDTSPEDRALIENLGAVVIEAPQSLEGKLRATPGVAQVSPDELRAWR